MRALAFLTVLSVARGYFYQDHAVNHPMRCPLDDPRWPKLFDAVQHSSSLIPQGRLFEARTSLSDAITDAMTDLNSAFNCSIGISSAFRVLALTFAADNSLASSNPRGFRRANQIALRLQHVAMNWLTHAFVIKGENDGRWIDESSWPLTIQEINAEQTAIQSRILASGPYGHSPTWPDCPYDYRDRSLKIAIVTMCDYPPGDVLPKYSLSNKELYSKRWGYPVIAENHRMDTSRPHAWSKMKLMEKHIERAEHDWLLWFDCDTFFMNFNVTLDHVLYSFASRKVSVQSAEYALDPSVHMIIQEDHAMLNTGVFFIRTSSWALDLVRRVYGDSSSPWVNHPWWENAAFSHEFLGRNHRKFKDDDLNRYAHDLSDSSIESADMQDIYGPHVIVTPQVVFNSYHPITSRVFQHDTWEPGKFVLAFSGCTSGSSKTVAQHIYGEYYREMCELNGVVDQCLEVEELGIHPWSDRR